MDVGLKSKSLPRFRILQVGDVHYPDWVTAPAAMDIKTRQLSDGVMAGLQVDGFQNLLRTISRNDFMEACDAVVFVGDFTTQGDQAQLTRAVRHLAGLFRINPHSKNPKFHAVPGNHDVSRENALALGMAGKFDPMARAMLELGFGSLPVLSPIALRPGDQSRPIQLLLTNTTLGSWEKTGLPEAVLNWIEKVTAREHPTPTRENSPEDSAAIPILEPSNYYDQLDTPFISKRSLLEIKQLIDNDDNQALPCIVGHHNILPQATPRVSPFGELLNQGDFRSSLLSVGRPVIYLHGHIHTDPVEIVSSPSSPGSKIISIGAPTLRNGVNILDIFFSRSGEPIGMMILPLRVGEDGHVSVTRQMQVSLRAHSTKYVAGRLAEQVVQALAAGRQTWAELRNAIPITDVVDDELEAVALELLWDGLVKIVSQTAPRQRWILELDR